ncbi:hypothetical protein BV921_02365 [Pectobacterium odoriferum]|uniref:Uncharacterized protein n=1 Tax=Pectobacterium odoriferum TaxID=78398 RepID=A0ABD6VUR2_9GAMM|nr:hypothetical protein BVY06_00175 [Pectobacterium odoriferum]POE01600.1 hypothetical protein BVY05_10340 [Pectobacterium odoriferum]POE13350.1 hypothetical protein BV921_02365 [Pectobacterium odoriferum]POE14970.1 hypothetical protein BV924_05460 [Pectobacterium odoriferum]POE28073.1 hypothetical protein BV926_03080 [Pectobacterium odoriferum]
MKSTCYKECDFCGDTLLAPKSSGKHILVILQISCTLATLLGSSLSLAPLGPLQAAFKSAPGRFVTHPNHLLV